MDTISAQELDRRVGIWLEDGRQSDAIADQRMRWVLWSIGVALAVNVAQVLG